MNTLIFMALGTVIGFLGGMLVGRWAHKRDRIAKLQMGFDPASGPSIGAVTVYEKGKLIGVLKV